MQFFTIRESIPIRWMSIYDVKALVKTIFLNRGGSELGSGSRLIVSSRGGHSSWYII